MDYGIAPRAVNWESAYGADGIRDNDIDWYQ